MTDKTCKQCFETKPITDFYRAVNMKDGHRLECKACFQRKNAWRYLAANMTPDGKKKQADSHARWVKANIDRWNAYQAKWTREHYVPRAKAAPKPVEE